MYVNESEEAAETQETAIQLAIDDSQTIQAAQPVEKNEEKAQSLPSKEEVKEISLFAMDEDKREKAQETKPEPKPAIYRLTLEAVKEQQIDPMIGMARISPYDYL